MLYELRHYDIRSSRDLEKVSGRFADPILPIWERLGIEPVGFWSVTIGTPSPRLTYILAWDDLAQRQAKWDAFDADEEWQKARADTNAAWGGSPIHTFTSAILKPTAFSRLPAWNNQPRRLLGGVFELRTYHFDTGDKLAQTVAWYGEQTTFQENHGVFAMGFWTTYIGVAPRLHVMFVFENLAHRERAWASYHTDPEWPARQNGLYPNGQPLIAHIESCMMTGTDFSGWR